MVFFMDNTVKEYGQQNFSLPHDVVQLPSGGKFYHNKKKRMIKMEDYLLRHHLGC
jgi:hypothetical protein